MSLEDARRQKLLRAHAHPLRLQILSLLTGSAMSAAELARELDISQALASYHLRFLVEAGTVELAEEVNNRGGRERRYRHPIAAAEPSGNASAAHEGHELMVTAIIDELRRRHTQREAGGRELMIDAELWVTDEQWLTFRDAVRDAGVRLHEQATQPRTPGTRRVSVSTVLFPMRTPRRTGKVSR